MCVCVCVCVCIYISLSPPKAQGSFQTWEDPPKKHPWGSPVVYIRGCRVQPALRHVPQTQSSCYPSSMSPRWWGQFPLNHLFLPVGRAPALGILRDPNAHLRARTFPLPTFLPWHWPVEADISLIWSDTHLSATINCGLLFRPLTSTSQAHVCPKKSIISKRKLGFFKTVFISNVFKDMGWGYAYEIAVGTPKKHSECWIFINNLLFYILPQLWALE